MTVVSCSQYLHWQGNWRMLTKHRTALFGSPCLSWGALDNVLQCYCVAFAIALYSSLMCGAGCCSGSGPNHQKPPMSSETSDIILSNTWYNPKAHRKTDCIVISINIMVKGAITHVQFWRWLSQICPHTCPLHMRCTYVMYTTIF